MRSAVPLLLPTLLCGCQGGLDSVAMTGRVLQSASDQADAAANATLSVRDVNGDEFSETTAGSDGTFSALVPTGAFFTLVIAGEDGVPTGFSGTASAGDFAVDDGTFWAMGQDAVDALEATWAGCPGVGEGGTALVGEVRVYFAGNDPEDLPTVTTASVKGRATAVGGWNEACYLDDDGVYSADATQSGDTGSFALFGLPAGSVDLRLNFTGAGQTSGNYNWRFYLPEGGIAPLYPAYVNLL